VRSAGSPSGTLAAGTTAVTLSLTTDETATCKYGTVADTAYASIASTFTTTGGTSHSQSLTGLTAGSYTYYVRCQDTPLNANTTDYAISFTIPSDGTAPSIPTNLTATATTTSQIGLSWTASTDDVAVTGYSIYRGGLPLASTTGTTYYSTGLTPSTLYSYTVSAYDAAGNDSGVTGAATATTNAPSTYYLSTTGSDSANGLTSGTAWATFAFAWTVMQPGDTLQIADGSYSTPSPPAAKSGTVGYPITITATNPGSVQITGPLTFTGSSYLTFIGLKITGTTQAVLLVSNGVGAPSHHLTFQQIGFTCTTGAGPINDNTCFAIRDGAHDVLLEDSWGWGGGL
jgi:chitodextrinase